MVVRMRRSYSIAILRFDFKQTDKQTDINDARVAFTPENLYDSDQLHVHIIIRQASGPMLLFEFLI